MAVTDTVHEYKNAPLSLFQPDGEASGEPSYVGAPLLLSMRLLFAERWRKRGIRFDTTLGRQMDFGLIGGQPTLRKNVFSGSWRGLVITTTGARLSTTGHARWTRASEPIDLTGLQQISSARLPHWSWKWRLVVEAASSGLYPISGSGPAGSGSGYVMLEDLISAEGELINLPDSFSNPEGASTSTRNLQLGMTRDDGVTITDEDWGPIYWN